MSNRSYSQIKRREKIVDIIAGVLIIPMFYIFTVLVFSL